MKPRKSNSRDKILAAAADVAREAGPGNLSLDAVASRAGISKGGLLYNFPSKAKLMQALVEQHLQDFASALEDIHSADGRKNLLSAYIRLSVEECQETEASASWIFSAIAEDPEFLTPIKTFKRQLFERLKAKTPDLKALLVTYLAIEGLRSMTLFEFHTLEDEERQLLVDSLLALAGTDAGIAG
ncbi:TetR/AcrR family transcriptional regulator [Aquamicrobium ahrensii]|uniref:AcrR family transcriptional regulator n=1 Tax=Aquamicrobium ahrensii TaxID=469551 RepID=A0ABV2KM21_9HYPH